MIKMLNYRLFMSKNFMYFLTFTRVLKIINKYLLTYFQTIICRYYISKDLYYPFKLNNDYKSKAP